VVLRALRESESNCYSVPQLMQFRTSPVVGDLLARFPLPVYFSMCFRKLTTPLAPLLAQSDAAAVLAGAAPKAKEENSSPFRFALTAAVLSAVHRCWSQDSFVVAIADRFLRLSLQIVARFRKWAQTVCAALTDRQSPHMSPNVDRRPIWETPLPVLNILADVRTLQAEVGTRRSSVLFW
jgi:conserved oligomeric Golgi complex subunit 2